MKKRSEEQWEFIIEDAKTDPKLKRELEQVIENE